jgi:hypothetical protein
LVIVKIDKKLKEKAQNLLESIGLVDWREWWCGGCMNKRYMIKFTIFWPFRL